MSMSGPAITAPRIRLRRSATKTLLACLTGLLAAIGPVAAEEPQDTPGRLAAVQQRKFRMGHELFAAASVLPLDAFYKGVGPTVSYTYHFTDSLGWEVIRASYSFNLNTKLRDQLEKDFGVAPTKFEQVQYHLETSANFAPLYGKFALLNTKVVHSELFLLGGATLARMTDAFRPGVHGGLGLRFFLSQAISARVEGRYHFVVGGGKSTQLLDIAAGLGIDFGGTD